MFTTSMQLSSDLRRGNQIPWMCSYKWLEAAHCGFWEINLGSLVQQVLFTSEASFFFMTIIYSVIAHNFVVLLIIVNLTTILYNSFHYIYWSSPQNAEVHRLSDPQKASKNFYFACVYFINHHKWLFPLPFADTSSNAQWVHHNIYICHSSYR